MLPLHIYKEVVLNFSILAHGTETMAYPRPDGTYTLHGYKWFTSATDSDMTLTLGRVVDEQGHIIQVCSISQS